jgi:hypothetical protein
MDRIWVCVKMRSQWACGQTWRRESRDDTHGVLMRLLGHDNVSFPIFEAPRLLGLHSGRVSSERSKLGCDV